MSIIKQYFRIIKLQGCGYFSMLGDSCYKPIGLMREILETFRCRWASWWHLTQRAIRFSAVSSPRSAPPLNVMDLKILHAPAPLATPAVSLQDFTAELAISFRIKPQPWALGTDPLQNVTCTSSRSCFRCGFGRPMTSRMRQGNRASRLTPQLDVKIS